MTRKEAIELMQSSKTVAEWNQNREIVKNSVTDKDWHNLYRKIDHNGMIVQTLKRNNPYKPLVHKRSVEA